MPTKQPYSRVAMRALGKIDEGKFYSDLARECGYIDEATAKRFYLGFVRTVTKHLRNDAVVRLPHLAEIALVWQQARVGFGGRRTSSNIAVQTILPPRRVIKFYPLSKWRDYLNQAVGKKPVDEDGLKVGLGR